MARTPVPVNALLGAVGTEGGTFPERLEQVRAQADSHARRTRSVERADLAAEYPLAQNEMSFLLPHFLKEGRGKLDVYFTRVYNPVWTNPDGLRWIEVLTDEAKVGLHVALTPTWSETAYFADYVLPMGHGSERHDTHSYEQYDGQWLGFRQPVLRAARERLGETVTDTREVNPGRGVGGERVLDRAVLADRPRRRARHPAVLRVARPAGREAHGGRVLRLDVRELGARPAREGGSREA